MKSFALDANGDLLIDKNEIQMINGTELIKQKAENVINTNIGEWSLNINEGVDFSNILGKHNGEEDIVKNEILKGLKQIDESFYISDFSMSLDNKTRKLEVKFKAQTDSGVSVDIVTKY